MAAGGYAESWRAWDERYAELVLGKRNWQLIAAGLLVLSLVLAGGMVWQAGRSRYLVYAVQVDKQGYALTQAQPLTEEAMPDLSGRIARYEVASYVRQARSVSSDSQVEQQQLNALLAHTKGAADRFLDEYFHSDPAEHNPFQVGQKQTVTVQIDSILQQSAKSYEVRWTEQRRDLNGTAAGLPTHWEAELQTAIMPPHEAEGIVSNPLGFYVERISWTEQQG